MATVKEIKEALADIDSLDDTRWQAYEKDSRAGVQKAIIQLASSFLRIVKSNILMILKKSLKSITRKFMKKSLRVL